MSFRLPDLERRINNLDEKIHHEVFHFLNHCIEAARKVEVDMQQENNSSHEYDMTTVHHTIDKSINAMIDVLEKTVSDWEHRLDKDKKNFSDGVN